MDLPLWATLTGVGSGAVGALLGFLAPKTRTLDSQRADFKAVLDPILDQLKDTRSRLTALETQRALDVRQHYKDQRRIDILTDYVQDLLAFIRQHVKSPEPPPIPPEFSKEI